MAIRIGIVDDNPHLIDSLKQNLAVFEEVEVVGRAGNGKEAQEMVRQCKPQVVLMDIEMPVMNGIAATAQLKTDHPEVKVLMLTVFDQDDKIFEAILAGASGYFLKDEKPHKLVEGLEEVLEGGAPMSARIATRALQLIRAPYQVPVLPPTNFGLSSRETEILEQLAEGLGYQDIAEKLFISPKTVRKHIENIYAKLQVHSKVDAVKLGIKNKWF